MVIRGGENVYPREIEEFLYTHPEIEDVQVIGVPDDAVRRGVDGVGQVAPRRAASEDDVRTYCQGRIAHFKIPRYVKFVDSFPMTVTGKVRRSRSARISIAELGLERSRDRHR